MPATPKTAPPPAYADTSFLFPLILHDANTAAVLAYLQAHAAPLLFTPWQRCELRNAVRLAVWRGHLEATNATLALARITADLETGNLRETRLVWPDVLRLADEL